MFVHVIAAAVVIAAVGRFVVVTVITGVDVAWNKGVGRTKPLVYVSRLIRKEAFGLSMSGPKQVFGQGDVRATSKLTRRLSSLKPTGDITFCRMKPVWTNDIGQHQPIGCLKSWSFSFFDRKVLSKQMIFGYY